MTATAKIDERPVVYQHGCWYYEDTGKEVEDFGTTGTLCQGCGRVYMLDLIVPDSVWEEIKPEGKSYGAGMLCPTCIMQRLEEHLGFNVVRLTI